MSYVDYYRYIQSDEWKIRRDIIYKDKKGRCELCGKKVYNDFNIHHVNYSNLGHENNDDTMLLCFECHRYYHKYRHK